MGECQLDDLLDILNDDDEAFEVDDPKPEKEKSQSTNDQNSDEDEVDEDMATKLREMEEQVRIMKEKMKKKNSNSSNGDGSPKSLPSSSLNNGPRSISEVDMFSPTNKQGMVSTNKKLFSPVKTNPLTEAERAQKSAVYVAKSTEWCPSHLKSTATRVLSKEEAEQVKKSIGFIDREREMAEIAKNDLACSDDEEGLTDFGKVVKKRIANSGNYSGVQSGMDRGREDGRGDVVRGREISRGWGDREGNKVSLGKSDNTGPKIMVERNSLIRIVNHCITQAQLNSAIGSRQFHMMSRVGEALNNKQCEGDWVTMGVLYYKHPTKQSSTGNDFSIWKMTDLRGRGEMNTVSLFLFGKAHKKHWSLPLNKVVGILNPRHFEDKGQKKAGDVSLSIDHPDKLLELGDSVDLAKCAHKKPAGGNCTNVVNKSVCEFCVYHVKAAYKASAGARPALQSSFSGGPDMTRARIMNKIAPKGEVFAGGKILNDMPAVVGKKSAASKARDNQLLAGLGGSGGGGAGGRLVDRVVSSGSYRGKPMGSLLSSEQKEVVQKVSKNVSEELGVRLLAPTPGARAYLATLVKEQRNQEEVANPKVKKTAKELLLEHKGILNRASTPKLGRGMSENGEVSLDLSPSMKSKFAAGHSKALAILALKGEKISKVDPNMSHRSKNRTPEVKQKVLKRMRDEDSDSVNSNTENLSANANKKARTDQKKVIVFGKEVSVEELEAIRNKKSVNSHLVGEAELEAADKYFEKAEFKDALEEKMLGTQSIKVKAVTCLTCNYTAFKSSELCKQEKHKIKVIDATKRFFSCKDCKNRTVSLDKLPKTSCSKCGGSNWVKAGMIAEKKGPKLDSETLSIRGNEESVIGCVVGTANINI